MMTFLILLSLVSGSYKVKTLYTSAARGSTATTYSSSFSVGAWQSASYFLTIDSIYQSTCSLWVGIQIQDPISEEWNDAFNFGGYRTTQTNYMRGLPTITDSASKTIPLGIWQRAKYIIVNDTISFSLGVIFKR